METLTTMFGINRSRRGPYWLTALLLLLALLLTGTGSAKAAETITYYYTSPQGTVLAKTDAAGNILSNADYRPYGSQALGSSEDGPGFTGHVNDADSGLIYMQARYYDPEVGRFLSVDPVSPSPGASGGNNRYWYGNANPFRYSDPTGKVVTCTDTSCTAESHSVVELVVDSATLAAIYTKVLIQNAINSGHANQSQDPAAPAPEAGTAESDEGCIYCVEGSKTDSGKPYVGSADDLGRRAATAKDGRDRTGAEKVDSYKKGDRTDRQNKEQRAINERGGRDALDNKRNEVREDKWDDRDIPPPQN